MPLKRGGSCNISPLRDTWKQLHSMCTRTVRGCKVKGLSPSLSATLPLCLFLSVSLCLSLSLPSPPLFPITSSHHLMRCCTHCAHPIAGSNLMDGLLHLHAGTVMVVVTGGLFRDDETPDFVLPYGGFREQLMPQHGTSDTRRYIIDPSR